MRNTIDSLRSRVAGLESVLVQAFSKLKDQRQKKDKSASPDVSDLPDFPRNPNGYGHDQQQRPGRDIYVGAEAGPSKLNMNGAAYHSQKNAAEAEEIMSREESLMGDDLREEEVAASLSLEYMVRAGLCTGRSWMRVAEDLWYRRWVAVERLLERNPHRRSSSAPT